MSTLLSAAQFSPADTPLVLSDLAAICGLSSMPPWPSAVTSAT